MSTTEIKPMFRLAAVSKHTDRITGFIGTEDTYSRVLNHLNSYYGTYQPKSWFVIVGSSKAIGDLVGADR